MPANLHYSADDARWIARHAEHVAAAHDLAAILPDGHDVIVSNTGGNCPGIIVSDGRPAYDVLVCENPGSDGAADAWCAAPEQDCENVHTAPTAVGAYLATTGQRLCAGCGTLIYPDRHRPQYLAGTRTIWRAETDGRTFGARCAQHGPAAIHVAHA